VRITQEAAPTLISNITIAFSFSSVFWIDASSDGTITQGLKGICNLPAAKSSGLDGSPESALHWIGLLKENYIMVFDNADVLSPAQLEIYFPPPGKGGNIMITSRNAAMQCLTLPENSLEVTEMEEHDAIELLLKASLLDPDKIDFQADALEIVKELCYLPLAIDQAGAYIASGVTTIGEYLAKYSDHRKTLLSHSEFTGASKYNRSVYGTWELSYKEIQKRAESDDSHKANAANSAMLLLQLFPFFHHEGITEEIFSYAALLEDEEICSSNLPCASSLLDRRLLPLSKSGIWDNFIFREGLRILLSFSLIKKGSSDCVYAMHPLVHTWGRDRLTLNKRTNCCLMAYVTLACSLRWDTSQPYGFRRVLVTHVRENMEYFKSEGSQNVVSYMDDAFAKFGGLLQEQGYFKEGETLLNEVLDRRKKFLGVEHLDTIMAMANLAAAYRDLGKYTEAEELDIQVLDERNRILGVEHLDTINAMVNLAATYHEQGKYTEAEKLKIQVVDARMRILGVEHPDTITAIQLLAVAYHELGKFTASEKLKIQVLDARNRILGPEHPETINTMGNLAATYNELGKYVEAEKLKIQVVDARSKIFGVEHPETLRAKGNLAATYRNLGKYTEAEKLEIQVLDARSRILGAEHPVTIRAIANLTKTYRSLKKYTEAEKLDIQVLDARNRILGVEHPETIKAVANLAETYRALGKYTEAEKLEIQVLDARNRILGVEHPETIRAMAALAATYGCLEKYIEAEKLEIQVLDVRNRILGVEHPDTTVAMKNLAVTYRNLARHKEAEKLEIQAHELKGRVLGPEFHTITTMANVQEAQEIQVLDAGSTVPDEENLQPIQVVLNHPVQADHPDTTTNSQKKCMYFSNCCLNPPLIFSTSVHFLTKLTKRVSKVKSKIPHLFHKQKGLDNDFVENST
jgi:tetratricopeptide (TPR) repeat protein